MNKIVIFHYASFGDMIWLVPPLLELRKKYPQAKIAVISGSKGVKVLEAFSICDDLFNIKDLFEPLKIGGWKRFFKYWRTDVWMSIYSPEKGFIFQLLLFPKKNIISHYQFGKVFDGVESKFCVFPPKKWQQELILLLSDSTFTLNHNEQHVSKNIFTFFEKNFELQYQEAMSNLRLSFKRISPQKLFLLSPFSTWIARNWRIEYWIELVQWLRKEFPDFKIVIFGSKNEKNNFETSLVVDSSVRFVAAEAFEEIIKISREASLVISNDSMMVHVSSLLNIPCVALFGPNIPFQFGAISDESTNLYYQLECSPCAQKSAGAKCLMGFQTCLALDKIHISQIQKIILNRLRKNSIGHPL